MFHTCISASTADSPRASRTSEDLVYRTREGESRTPAKLGAQCAFGMFIAILMTGIFPEARAEPVVLRPLAPGERIEIARAGPVVLRPPASPGGRIEITTGLARLLPLEKRAKTVIVGDHNLIEEGVPLPPTVFI